MSDAPDIRRPAARTRTAAYFILFSPRYVSFRDLLMAPRRVPVYTSPLPLTPFFGKPFVEIGAVRTRSTSTGTSFARQNAEYSRKRTTEYTGDGGLVYTDSTLGRPNWKLRANPLRGENNMGRIAIRLLLTAAGCLWVAAAQDQPGFVRDTCVKVAPGKGAELEAMLHDVTAKQMRVRIDEGHAAWWLALSAVVPPETPTPEQSTAELKKAGLNMTIAEYAAKRNSLSTLVNVDIWRSLADVGPSVGEGNYLRLNSYKVKPGQQAAWRKLETTGWKPFVESLKDSHLGWHLHTLAMPAGEYLHYNALTVDTFPSWTALGQGVPVNTAWPKVHPDMPGADYLSLVNNTVERYRVDVIRVVEVVQPK